MISRPSRQSFSASISPEIDHGHGSVDNEIMNVQPRNRQLPADLARRLHGALTAKKEQLYGCLQDPAPEVLRSVLKNPALQQEHLLVLLQRRDLPEDLLKNIYQLDHTGASRRLKLALVRNPATPTPIVQTLLPHLHLFELVDLCYLPGVTPDQRLAAERAILLRLESLPLGNKITLARRGTAAVVGELVKTGEPRLMEPCLGNPRLKEVAIVQFLRGPRAAAESISAIARHPRWKNRPNLRLAMLKNRHTPPVWHTLWLPSLRRSDLNSLLLSQQLSAAQKQLIEIELKRRGR